MATGDPKWLAEIGERAQQRLRDMLAALPPQDMDRERDGDKTVYESSIGWTGKK